MGINKNKYAKVAVLLIFILIAILFFSKINSLYNNGESIIKNSGNVAPLIYILMMIVAILIAPIPSSPLAIIGGALFGPWLGMIYTLIGATIGATLAFLIARFFLRDYLSKKLEQNKFYLKIKGKKEKNIARIIFITRLMPHISFDVVSYAAGLTRLNVFTFAIVTFLGMIPIVFLLSFFGSLIQPFLPIVFIIISIFFVLYIVYLVLNKKN